MNGKLLLVIPPVVAVTANGVLVDEHFGNNLRSYLASFEQVTVACPAMAASANMIPLSQIAGSERCAMVVLPEPYREDRFYRNYLKISRLLRKQIEAADYLLLSPHAAFDWSTLATRIALAMGRDYNMEGDWNLQNVVRTYVNEMRFGFARLRRSVWHRFHTRYYLDSMRKSRLALLQGAAVFEAYKHVAPNPHKVLNVQVTAADRISQNAFAAKIQRVRSGAPLRIFYAGRAIAMKGPQDWQQCVQLALSQGLNASATWIGDGDLLESLRTSAIANGVSDRISYPGTVPRSKAFEMLREADIFLFCHMTDESPRCLIEALTAGTPIVGYGSLYANDLVADRGGGEFVSLGHWRQLAKLLTDLDGNRGRLATLMHAAQASSLLYERDEAIEHRIDLMRSHLRLPAERQGSNI